MGVCVHACNCVHAALALYIMFKVWFSLFMLAVGSSHTIIATLEDPQVVARLAIARDQLAGVQILDAIHHGIERVRREEGGDDDPEVCGGLHPGLSIRHVGARARRDRALAA